MSSFEIKYQEIAGFTLAGWRTKQNVIELQSRQITEWPDEITLLGTTYTLEEVIKLSTRPDGAIFENAEYV